jgi:hypothetical protein
MDRMNAHFSGRLAIQQRVLTPYRAAFFDALAKACDGGVTVLAGLPRPEESIATTRSLQVAQFTFARNFHLLRGPLYFCIQPGLVKWLADSDPEALIVEANPRYLSTSSAVHWMKQHGRPVIGWGLGAPALMGLLSTPRMARRVAFLRQFDGLITYSRRGADEYAALGFPAGRIFVAPNAAAPRPASPMPVRSPAYDGRT